VSPAYVNFTLPGCLLSGGERTRTADFYVAKVLRATTSRGLLPDNQHSVLLSRLWPPLTTPVTLRGSRLVHVSRALGAQETATVSRQPDSGVQCDVAGWS
jgi:hypothetical protein